MLAVRVIPSLLLRNGGLVKGSRFKDHKYVGDPINAVKIFNEKEVDELVFLDIGATQNGTGPNFELLADIASQAFMPFGYGGGITSIEQIEKLFKLGVEKVILNTAAYDNEALISAASKMAGAQSIVVSIDVKKSAFGAYNVFTNSGSKKTKWNPVDFARHVEQLGAGEILLCSMDREGTAKGYDTKLIENVADAVDIPVVALGGARNIQDFGQAVSAGASAVSAGDMFTFHGKFKAVLITYPPYDELQDVLGKALA